MEPYFLTIQFNIILTSTRTSSIGLFFQGIRIRFCSISYGTHASYTLYTWSFLLGFNFLTAVVMKSSIFWDITRCNLLKINTRFGGNIFAFIFRACYLPLSAFLLGLFFNSEDGGEMFIRNVHWFWKDYTSLYRARQNFWSFILSLL
jgi:hypothetical protein